uniref:CSON014934 protein n=1 Tax=Culicoides sonorensis TaxID=179676 RepID=A0A336MET4_CULSO
MDSKMEKEPQSLSVQMKPEYASSEVYSTVGSEAPPAYVKRQANSVKIAKIIAGTILLASFILGGFILAATYMQSRAMCDQMQTLENALDKEIMLEMLAQELPKASALQGRDYNDNDIESDVKKPSRKDSDIKDTSSSDSSSDSQYSDSDESQDMNRVQFKLPLDIDLNELASKFMQSNQKTKMNCVVERRRAEELSDGAPAKMVQLPFGINLQTEQKPKRVITGERIAIVCESNVEQPEDEEPEIHVRQFIVPIHQQQMPIPYGRMPNPGMGPLTHMPMRIEPPRAPEQAPPQMMAQMQPLPPFLREIIAQQLSAASQARQELPVPPQVMQAPPLQQPQVRFFHAIRQEPEMPVPQQQQQQQMNPQPEVRIQLHRIAIPGPIRIAEQSIDRDEQPEQQQQEPEQNRMQMQQVPLNIALQRAGITPEDLINIQKIAETNFRREMSRYIQDIDEESDSGESDEEQARPQIIQIQAEEEEKTLDSENNSNTNENTEQKQETTVTEETQPQENPNILPMGRSGYARSLLKPVNIPVQMMPKGELAEETEAKDVHMIRPRSV